MSRREYVYPHDFYNMQSDDELTLLEHFKTHQGKIPYACGPNAALLVLHYYNDYSFSERELFYIVDCKQPEGTRIKNIVDFFRRQKYEVETSIEQPKKVSGKIFDTMEEFRDFVISNLKKGYPIIVESVYYGGHYQVIIGYDKRSATDYFHDMLIFADPSDDADDYVDGYTYFSAIKFFAMWFDDRYLPMEHRMQPYIVVKGKKT
ncbi:MAG: C39 family peptidase [Bacilli bacterium]|nr:C39 family peptidase [Bacilli bacterium]